MNNMMVPEPFIQCRKAYELVRAEVLYNIHIEFGIPMNTVRLIIFRICFSKNNKYLSDAFPTHNGLKWRSFITTVNFVSDEPLRWPKKIRRKRN